MNYSTRSFVYILYTHELCLEKHVLQHAQLYILNYNKQFTYKTSVLHHITITEHEDKGHRIDVSLITYMDIARALKHLFNFFFFVENKFSLQKHYSAQTSVFILCTHGLH